jgi:hypothetical protein
MAQGDKKRTFKITERADEMVEVLRSEGKLDKSDNVDRAIKLYYRLLKEGKLENDPYVEQERIQRLEKMADDDSGSSSGITDRVRDKLSGDKS